MKKGSTLFLKIVLVLIGLVAFTGIVLFPQTEGRAANLDLVHIYSDPFILYGFLASTPFFIALYQAFKLLRYVDKNSVFSKAAVIAVRNIKYCALSLIGFIVAALLYIRLMIHGEDPAGPTMIGILTIIAAGVITTAAGITQKLLQNAVDLKSEHDLTV